MEAQVYRQIEANQTTNRNALALTDECSLAGIVRAHLAARKQPRPSRKKILLVVFQQFSLVSPLANAVAVPVISFIVTPLALLAALLPWTPIFQAGHWVLDGLMPFLGWCAGWPVWQAAAPPWWAAVVAGLGVAICLLPRGIPGRAMGLIFILPLLFWPAEEIPPGEARIDVLDVGQGDQACGETACTATTCRKKTLPWAVGHRACLGSMLLRSSRWSSSMSMSSCSHPLACWRNCPIGCVRIRSTTSTRDTVQRRREVQMVKRQRWTAILARVRDDDGQIVAMSTGCQE